MPWGAVAGAVIGGVMQNNAANKSANATEKASQASIAEQQREFDLARQDQMPWLQAGQWGLGQIQNALKGDWSGFYASPDYAYALDQGIKSSDRSAAAHGALGSGGHSADLMALGQGLATQNYGNYMNRLSGLSGLGQTTAANLGQLGQSMANSIGNAYMNAGNARASSYLQQGNNYAGMAGALGNAFGQWYGSQQAPQTGYGMGYSGMMYSAPTSPSGGNWMNGYGG